jgi:hypothetical protein
LAAFHVSNITPVPLQSQEVFNKKFCSGADNPLDLADLV